MEKENEKKIKNDNIRKNFIIIFEELKKHGYVKGQIDFANKIEQEQPNVSRMISGGRAVSGEALTGIFKAFPFVNKDFAYNGTLPIFIIDNKNADLNRNAPYLLVPLINPDFVGGLKRKNEVSNTEPIYIEGYIPFNNALHDDICAPVTGDSMIKSCPSGSIVLLRQVKNWNEFFGFGNIFCLVLKDGRRIIKEINSIEGDKENVLCISHNDNISPEELPKSLIQEVWKVVKILTEKGF